MKVLGVDTSTKYLTLAVVEDGVVLAEKRDSAEASHSKLLIMKIKEILTELNLSLDELGGIAVSLGPGSFTGLRIGVATAKGLGFASNIPLVGVPTLDVIAENGSFFEGRILALVDARKSKVYTAFFEMKKGKMKKKSNYLLTDIKKALAKTGRRKTLVLGDGIRTYYNEIKKRKSIRLGEESLWYPKASVVAIKGEERLLRGERDDIDKMVPLYLYSQECTITGK